MYKLVYITEDGARYEEEHSTLTLCRKSLASAEKSLGVISWLILSQDQSVLDEG